MIGADGLIQFIDASPSPFHACAEAGTRLEAAGFTEVAEHAAWPAGGKHFITRGGTLVAWAIPDDALPATSPFRIIGAHTDSPNLRVKPRPDIGRAGARQLGVEVYGGPLLNSWLGRDLGLSGRVAVRDDDGRIETHLVKFDRALVFLPQLAIHLDREINLNGLKLNPQEHLNPVWGVGPPDEGGFARFLAKELGVDDTAVTGWDVMTHDLTPAGLVGGDDELLAAARLDNLCSAFAAVAALAAAREPGGGAIPVISLFDHEEVGSTTAQGAGGPVLATVIERLVLGRGGSRDDLHRALAGSVCVSSDMAHATHPNYAERHDPAHWITLNGGPVVKTNVSQRYATNAASAAVFVEACERAGVPVQQYVHRNDMPCGSTIGPITAAALGVAVVDVGAPQLAMHSARELMGAADVGHLADALTAFLSPA